MINKYLTMISMLTVTFFSNCAFADEVIKESASGKINWSEGVVYAIGYGTAKPSASPAQKRILSRRAAVVDAQRNLLEMTKGVRLTSVLKTDQAMKESVETASRVEGIIKGAQIVKQNYQNNIATVTMAMPIAGKFLQTVYSNERFEEIAANETRLPRFTIARNKSTRSELASVLDTFLNVLIPPVYAVEPIVVNNDEEAKAYRRLLKWMDKGVPANVDQLLSTAITNYESNNQFSGLLIDASLIANFELATIPKIRDEKGNVLYPGKETSYDNIIKRRGVTYDFDLDDAIKHKRVATSPFVIKALSTYKNLDSDLIISMVDAQKISRSASTRNAMNKAGVLIVVAL